MRSDRDNRTDTEREIDAFLSKFENPADDLSADIDSYIDSYMDSYLDEPGYTPRAERHAAVSDAQKSSTVAAAQSFV